MGFNLGNAIKYLWRAGLKPGVCYDTDLEKAIWYIQREIERKKRTQEGAEKEVQIPFNNGKVMFDEIVEKGFDNFFRYQDEMEKESERLKSELKWVIR